MVAPAVAFIALLLIDRMPDKDIPENPYFDRQKWTLREGYLVLIPTAGFACVTYSPPDGSFFALAGLSLLSHIVLLTATCALYYLLIHKLYHVDTSLFGLDKLSFLSKGVLTANVAIPLSLLAFHSSGQMATLQPPLEARPAPEAAMIAASSLLSSCLVIPLRELLFRGVLYPPVARKIGRYPSIIVLSFIECLIYVNPFSGATLMNIWSAVLVAFLSSLVWYGFYMWTKSLYPLVIVSMAFHWWITKSGICVALGSRVDAAIFDQVWFYIPLAVLIVIDMYWIMAKFSMRDGLEKQGA
jgi:membrane protease YdiL (CAAX protease family)